MVALLQFPVEKEMWWWKSEKRLQKSRGKRGGALS